MSPVDWFKPVLLFTVAFLMAIIYFKFIPTQSNSKKELVLGIAFCLCFELHIYYNHGKIAI